MGSIEGRNLTNWKIVFKGVPTKNQSVPKEEERFNIHGITGCLTIYNSSLNNTDLEVSGGRCEDSLNIISSTGDARNVKIISAFSDAIDVDFSSVTIDHIVVEDAGNDCYDVSGGNYAIKRALLSAVVTKQYPLEKDPSYPFKTFILIKPILAFLLKTYHQ